MGQVYIGMFGLSSIYVPWIHATISHRLKKFKRNWDDSEELVFRELSATIVNTLEWHADKSESNDKENWNHHTSRLDCAYYI